MVHAIVLIVTGRSAAIFGLKVCEHKSPCPDVAQASLSFFEIVNFQLIGHIEPVCNPLRMYSAYAEN